MPPQFLVSSAGPSGHFGREAAPRRPTGCGLLWLGQAQVFLPMETLQELGQPHARVSLALSSHTPELSSWAYPMP